MEAGEFIIAWAGNWMLKKTDEDTGRKLTTFPTRFTKGAFTLNLVVKLFRLQRPTL